MMDNGSPGNDLRRRVLRIHGTVLIGLTITNEVIITIGYYTGRGLYAALRDQPLGFGGLWQAYGIMMVVGIALWIGSFQPNPRLFDAIGLIAHVPTLFGLIAFPDSYRMVFGGHLAVLSAPIHTIFILIEAFAICWKAAWMPIPSWRRPVEASR
jgi:hypothetical protein